MDDELHAINLAKTEFREGFNSGDASRLMSIVDPDLVCFADGQPSGFGASDLEALKHRLVALFQQFYVQLAVIIVEIRVHNGVAYDYGWHDLTVTPKAGGPAIHRRDRYVDIWRRNKQGDWKLWMYMDNRDVPGPLGQDQLSSRERET
jgi:ketosteroid isomerase-like protein